MRKIKHSKELCKAFPLGKFMI